VEKQESARTILLAFGLNHMVVEKLPSDPGSCGFSDCTANLLGKPACSSETGELGSTAEEWIAMAVRGAWRIMRFLKMLPVPAAPGENSARTVALYSGYIPVKSPATGIFYPAVELQQEVAEEEILGTITDFFGVELAKVRAPTSGVVCGLVMHPPITEGEELGNVCPRARDQSP
jgi:predicted deacylase